MYYNNIYSHIHASFGQTYIYQVISFPLFFYQFYSFYCGQTSYNTTVNILALIIVSVLPSIYYNEYYNYCNYNK